MLLEQQDNGIVSSSAFEKRGVLPAKLKLELIFFLLIHFNCESALDSGYIRQE